jgi:hypothetical protein
MSDAFAVARTQSQKICLKDKSFGEREERERRI